MEHESEGDIKCNWHSRCNQQRISTGSGGHENRRMSGDHPNYRIVEIGQNTEKSPEDLRKFTVTQISVKNIR